MKRTTSFLVRVALMAVALALAVVFVGRGADTPTVEAISFNPMSEVSLSDPTPGANGDLMISFSIDAPDPFVNITDKSTIQFIPKQWDINGDAPIGTIGGTFDALATLGILGMLPCTFSITFGPTMYVSSTDTGYDPDTGTYDPDKLTSSLDLEGHPGGPGFSGEFVPDTDDPDELYGGISRYPDFLTELFPPETYGEPLVRLWGGQNVLLAAIPLNIVIFPPGAAPGYPPSEGYPVYIVLLDPVAPVDLLMLTITSDLCTDLSLVNTSLGIGLDNPNTAADEGGVPLMTNPQGAGDYVFKNLSWSQPDADDDTIENWLDTCMFDPNTEDVDGRTNDADGDGLDGACDPDPLNPSPSDPSGLGVSDDDGDNYANRADLCPVVQNGIGMDVDSVEMKQVGEFVFPFALYTDLVGPDNQADADGDRIGDACEGSEHGPQCANDLDDDGDGKVNDGCPMDPADNSPESGAECDNDVDDDGDGAVNDGCPTENNQESGAECDNDLDDDGDGGVNDGCPGLSNEESGAECDNDLDDDGDGLVNDGCPRFPSAQSESGDQCANDIDDDFDGVVNDGCPRFPSAQSESDAQCDNAVDDDWDGMVNDGCPGYPVYIPAPDIGLPLAPFAANELHTAIYYWEPPYNQRDYLAVYRDLDDDGTVSPGDLRLRDITPPPDTTGMPDLACGTVMEGDWDDDESFMGGYMATGLYPWINNEKHDDIDGNGETDCNELIYADLDDSGDVSNGDVRAFLWEGDWATIVGAPIIQKETGAECENAVDDNDNGWVNEGCPTVNNQESGDQCTNAVDDDGDGLVNDGCSTVANQESGDECANALDDDEDGVVNDGCPRFPSANNESGDQCDNALDDDFDGKVNDGCPRLPPGWQQNESGAQCDNAVDDDFDGKVNDGCPTVAKWNPETGDQCDNAADDDADGRVNDGCPAIDPGDVAKMTETGTVHHVILERTVHIYRHGVKLNNLGGPKLVKHPSAKSYSVAVASVDTAEEIQVALKVVPAGCATVNGAPDENSTVVSVGPGGGDAAHFTVDWSACPDGVYTVQADACHAGDVGAGFFGAGDCPGVSDGMVDTNPNDDAPMSKDVTVGSP
jgi:hypothetical protein